ncbi:hypothetical protein [Pseudonocardia acaciae]|uniref:hypothetical protein n=1 Tax=Pseudonocardia acaciae TaxID=551276 RepID=UPI0006883128|nr:hypothetical protein [Pseudonocardia acaciae]
MARTDPELVAGLVGWLDGQRGVTLAAGLTEAELDRAERAFGVRMPGLWRAVLARAYPVTSTNDGIACPDWRFGDEPGTRELVDGPVEGLLFDVEQNGFWWHGWGDAPAGRSERLRVARRRLAEVPRLTPLVGHLYVGPDDASPVFSIVQADLYVPALTLADLVTGRDQSEVPAERYPIGSVPFWSELHAYAALGHDKDSRFAGLATGGL